MKPSITVSAALYRRERREVEALAARHDLVLSQQQGESDHTILIDEGITVRVWVNLPHRQAERLTLLFHTLDEALRFIADHRDPKSEYPDLIKEYAAYLRDGKLVAFPTETVYGLGADATCEEAVRSIFKAKERPLFDPLIVHVAAVEQLDEVASDLDDRTRSLIEHFWPGPLTLVVK